MSWTSFTNMPANTILLDKPRRARLALRELGGKATLGQITRKANLTSQEVAQALRGLKQDERHYAIPLGVTA